MADEWGAGYTAGQTGMNLALKTAATLERLRIIKLLESRTVNMGVCCSVCANDLKCGCDSCEKDCEDDWYSPLEALVDNGRTPEWLIALIKGEQPDHLGKAIQATVWAYTEGEQKYYEVNCVCCDGKHWG